jgi:hypothetical protein
MLKIRYLMQTGDLLIQMGPFSAGCLEKEITAKKTGGSLVYHQ